MLGLSEETKRLIGVAILSIILTATVTYYYTWKLSHDEQEAELQNIAQALYIDVSSIEEKFNYSMSQLPLHYNNSSELNSNPNAFLYTTDQYYSNNGLYYVFSKDIKGFDSNASNDLYNFYNTVLDIENNKEVTRTIVEKYLHGDQIAPYDVIKMHQSTKANYMIEMPFCIMLAEKIKQELRQEYKVKAISLPLVVINRTPEMANLQGGQIRVSTAF